MDGGGWMGGDVQFHDADDTVTLRNAQNECPTTSEIPVRNILSEAALSKCRQRND